jgi:hypothetical protein
MHQPGLMQNFMIIMKPELIITLNVKHFDRIAGLEIIK